LVRYEYRLIFAVSLPCMPDITTILETAAFVLSLAGVLLAIKPYTANWPVAMAGTLLYAWVFNTCQLYSDMVLQFFFIVVQAYGWRRWTIKNRAEFPISSLTPRRWLGEAALFVLGWSVWTTLILNFPSWIATIYDVNIPQAQMPWLDSFTASLSVWAISLQARRKWENWILWLLADSIYIPLYISVGKPLTALLYGIFLLLALSGLRSWYQQRV